MSASTLTIGGSIAAIISAVILVGSIAYAGYKYRKRKGTLKQLGDFMIEGRNLQSHNAKSAKKEDSPPEKELQDLITRIEKFLRENLGERYVARLHSNAGLPMGISSIMSIPHRNIEGCLDVWLARLNEFMEELEH